MTRAEAWKNFELGQELSVAGTFIYNEVSRFHTMRTLDLADEMFDFFYTLSVGMERLLKVAIVLLEHEDVVDQKKFEQTLITHRHIALAERVKRSTELNFSKPQNELLGILESFYKTLRYERFSLSPEFDLKKEQRALCAYLEKHLSVSLESRSPLVAVGNDDRYRRFISRTINRIARELYRVIRERATELNLYTYELRSGSKAEMVFLGNCDFEAGDLLWRELLIFFMNTEETSGLLRFLRAITPLGFDPGLADDYLRCFQTADSRSAVLDEMESLNQDINDREERRGAMSLIGISNVDFDDEDETDLEQLK